jgi:hypothetical protein
MRSAVAIRLKEAAQAAGPWPGALSDGGWLQVRSPSLPDKACPGHSFARANFEQGRRLLGFRRLLGPPVVTARDAEESANDPANDPYEQATAQGPANSNAHTDFDHIEPQVPLKRANVLLQSIRPL